MLSKGLDFSCNQAIYAPERAHSSNSIFSSQQVYPSLESHPLFSPVQEIGSGSNFSTAQDYSTEKVYLSTSAISQVPMFSEESLSKMSLFNDDSSKAADSSKLDFSKTLVDIGDTGLSLDTDYSQGPVLASDVVLSLDNAISAMSHPLNSLSNSNLSEKQANILETLSFDVGYDLNISNELVTSEVDHLPRSVNSSSDFDRDPANSSDKIISLEDVISTMYPESTPPPKLDEKPETPLKRRWIKKTRRTIGGPRPDAVPMSKTKVTKDTNGTKLNAGPMSKTKVTKDTNGTKLNTGPTSKTKVTKDTNETKLNGKDKKKKKKKSVLPDTASYEKQAAALSEFVAFLNPNSVPNKITYYPPNQVLPPTPSTSFSSVTTNDSQEIDKQFRVASEVVPSEEHGSSLKAPLFSEVGISPKTLGSKDAVISLEDAISVICSEPNISEEVYPQDAVSASGLVISLEPTSSQEPDSQPDEVYSLNFNMPPKSEVVPRINISDTSANNSGEVEDTKFSSTKSKVVPTKITGSSPIFERGIHGNPIITISGRRFSKQKTIGDGTITRWFCSTHAPNGCKAYLHTSDNTIVKCVNTHNHKNTFKNEDATPLEDQLEWQ